MRSWGKLLAILSLVVLPPPSAAEDFPAKPIRLIVPFPPGGPNDIIARVIGQRMSEIVHQPIVIDNRGGQAGVLGTDAIAKSAPDGYTIGIVSASALSISPTMEKVAYDVARDFAPITLVATVPEMLVVASSVPARDTKELVALAKAEPGKLNFASAGTGGITHLAGELFKLTAKIDIVHVPYRGAAPAINDLLGQQVQMAFLDLPVILPHIKAGTLRAIVLGAKERVPTAPDVPTTAEVGMPDILIENWYGMIAPAGTPPPIIDRLNRVATEAMADPAVKEKLADQGLALVPQTPEQFRAYIASETARWAKVIKDAGVETSKGIITCCPYASLCCGAWYQQICNISAPVSAPLSALRGSPQVFDQVLGGPRQRLEAARADHEPAVGPGVADPDDRERHRTRIAFGCGLRHHGNADVGRHHLADRIEIAQARAIMRAHAESGSVFCDMLLLRRFAREPDEVAGGELLEVDQAPARERPAPRGY